MHPLIDSIYLVNRNSDYVLSTNTNEALEMYEDKRFIQRAIDESHFSNGVVKEIFVNSRVNPIVPLLLWYETWSLLGIKRLVCRQCKR